MSQFDQCWLTNVTVLRDFPGLGSALPMQGTQICLIPNAHGAPESLLKTFVHILGQSWALRGVDLVGSGQGLRLLKFTSSQLVLVFEKLWSASYKSD